MQSSFYHCIIQVLYITHNTCGICDISENVDRKLRTNQIHVIKCLLLTCDNAFVTSYSCTNCDNFGFSVTYLVTLMLMTLSVKLVTMLHRTNIRLLNWAVNLFTLFLWSSNENLPFELWHFVVHCDTWTMWHGHTVTQTLWHRKCRLIMCNPSKPNKWKLLHRSSSFILNWMRLKSKKTF